MSQSFSLGAVVGTDAGNAGRELAETGRARRHGVIPEQACAWLAREQAAASGWRICADAERELELRPLDDRGFAGLAGGASVVRHGAGGRGLPPLDGTGWGFTLDLNRGWRSSWGGLLLFVEADGTAKGWRPEAGALTLYDLARPPLLTAVVPGAPARLSVVGRAA